MGPAAPSTYGGPTCTSRLLHLAKTISQGRKSSTILNICCLSFTKFTAYPDDGAWNKSMNLAITTASLAYPSYCSVSTRHPRLDDEWRTDE